MNQELLINAIKISVEAGKKILEVYDSAFNVEYKADRSPLTEADKRSHELISSSLEKYGFPVMSEEGKDISYEARSKWENYWCVDPLDGTKEFVKRNGEFAVNIAFMNRNTPVFGIIYQPVTEIIYAGMHNSVYRLNASEAKTLSAQNLQSFVVMPLPSVAGQINVVASRSHLSAETENFIRELGVNGDKISLVNAGSALKFCLLASGKADIYPRFAPTMEWDTAAGHAILKACGKNIYLHPSGSEMIYNKPSLVNDWFIAR